jgi:DNA-binding beta-propeller fold protein YncE
VASFGAGTVTPISTQTGRAGRPIPAGYAPDALAVSRNGQTLNVVDGNTDRLTTISLVTRHAQTIRVGYSPAAVAMLGNTAYVVSTISGTVLPVGSGHRDKPISVGLYSYPTTLTLAGATAVVLDTYSGQVSLVDTGARKAFAPIRVGNFPVAVAISG